MIKIFKILLAFLFVEVYSVRCNESNCWNSEWRNLNNPLSFDPKINTKEDIECQNNNVTKSEFKIDQEVLDYIFKRLVDCEVDENTFEKTRFQNNQLSSPLLHYIYSALYDDLDEEHFEEEFLCELINYLRDKYSYEKDEIILCKLDENEINIDIQNETTSRKEVESHQNVFQLIKKIINPKITSEDLTYLKYRCVIQDILEKIHHHKKLRSLQFYGIDLDFVRNSLFFVFGFFTLFATSLQ